MKTGTSLPKAWFIATTQIAKLVGPALDQCWPTLGQLTFLSGNIDRCVVVCHDYALEWGNNAQRLIIIVMPIAEFFCLFKYGEGVFFLHQVHKGSIFFLSVEAGGEFFFFLLGGSWCGFFFSWSSLRENFFKSMFKGVNFFSKNFLLPPPWKSNSAPLQIM